MKYWPKLATIKSLAKDLHLYFHKVSNSHLMENRSKVDHAPDYLEGVFAYFDKRLDDVDMSEFKDVVKELTKQINYLHHELEELRNLKDKK